MHDSHLDEPCASRRIPAPDHREVAVRTVMVLAAATMLVEIVVGWTTHSMALLADGWHMATHVGALGVASLSYWAARRYATQSSFGFGTGKISALAGYTNALVLGGAAIMMVIESARRLAAPQQIDFATSLPVAIGGLIVNLVSMRILHARDETAEAHHEDGHHHAHHHHDHNHRAVALHLVADAFTSALAIGALAIGYMTGIRWLDAVTGIVGGFVVMHWVVGLCRHTSVELLDCDPAGALQQAARTALEQMDDVRVIDLHVWSLGRGQHGCVATLIASQPHDPDVYRNRILAVPSLVHVTVEVRRCHGHHETSQPMLGRLRAM
jgi:cation diffusion facilitator family transporter